MQTLFGNESVNEKQSQHQALYRKYRPNHFDGLIGQEAIKKTIVNSLTNATISHAYLFTGPRGTGKTTTAKLFARALNCEKPNGINPCGSCDSCKNSVHDVIELDAASNNKVEDMRELCDNVSLAPMYGKYKIYILDEVHMLTTSAFNAFLKTLEEPPSHAIFILATTEVHKLPATILSRCQRFDFRRIDNESIVSRLKYVLEQEGRKAEETALNLIAQVSAGGLRDALSLLDQALSSKTSVEEEVLLDDILALTGAVDVRIIGQLISLISEGKTAEALEHFTSAFEAGKDPKFFIEEMLLYLRDILVFKKLGPKATLKKGNTDKDFDSVANRVELNKIYFYLDELQETMNKSKFHHDLQLLTEMMIIRMSQSEKSSLQQQIDELRSLIQNGLPINANEVQQGTPSNMLDISDVAVPTFNPLENNNQVSNDIETPQSTPTNTLDISNVEVPTFNSLQNEIEASQGTPTNTLDISNNESVPNFETTPEANTVGAVQEDIPSFDEIAATTVNEAKEVSLFDNSPVNDNANVTPQVNEENSSNEEVVVNDPIGFIEAAKESQKNGVDWTTQLPSEVETSGNDSSVSEGNTAPKVDNQTSEIGSIPSFNEVVENQPIVPENEAVENNSVPSFDEIFGGSSATVEHSTLNQEVNPSVANEPTIPTTTTNVILSEKEKAVYQALQTARSELKEQFLQFHSSILQELGDENISSKGIFREFTVGAVNEQAVILIHKNKVHVQLIEKAIHRKNIKEAFKNCFKPLDYIAITEKEWETVVSLFKK